MSKGTIQAEELRGQLGEALPGAFGIMAKAVGVTEQELSKMMKAGELLASEVLPKFAKQLEITYGIENINRIETMTTAQNRLSNAWTNFVATISASDGVLTKFLTKTISSLTKVMDGLRLMTMTEKERDSEMQKQIVDKRVKEYQDYIETLDLTNKAVVRNLQIVAKADIERAIGIRKEVEALEERNKVLANYGIGGTSEIRENNKKINALKVLYEQYLRQAEVLDDTVDLANKQTKGIIANTNATEGNTKVTKDNNDEKKKEVELLKGSEAWFEKQISDLKEIRSTTADTTDEYKSFNAQLAILEDGLKALRGELTALDGEGLKLDFEAMGLTADAFAKWRKDTTEQLETAGDNWKNVYYDWTNVAMNAINLVEQAQDMAYQKNLQRLEKQKAIDLRFAGDSATAKEEIERQYNQKKNELDKKRFEQEKKTNLVKATIDTASAVIEALPNIPLSVAVGLLGAVQIGLIASQQYPEFYKGTDNAPEGMAWTQERGAEIIADKSGKIKSLGTNKGAQLTHLNKGDKVFTANESREIMFNNDLNNILLNNGISGSNTVVNNSVDLSPLNDRIDNLASIIKNKSSITIVNDRRGKRIFEEKQKSRKELVSNTIRANGQDV